MAVGSATMAVCLAQGAAEYDAKETSASDWSPLVAISTELGAMTKVSSSAVEEDASVLRP
jgi:hypothetical protein